jgi:hypothetical protein
MGVPIMFEAIRAIQATTDSPYHRPQPIETKSHRPAFSLDLAYHPSEIAAPNSEPMSYSSDAIHALHDALMIQSYPVDARKLQEQRRRSDQRTGLHAADISLLAFIDGLNPDAR